MDDQHASRFAAPNARNSVLRRSVRSRPPNDRLQSHASAANASATSQSWEAPHRLPSERQPVTPFKSWRITGRDGMRRATVLNPTRLNAEAVPVKMLAAPPGRPVTTGYASSAGARARLVAFKAAAIRTDITPRLR